jgi:hypothetical protein
MEGLTLRRSSGKKSSERFLRSFECLAARPARLPRPFACLAVRHARLAARFESARSPIEGLTLRRSIRKMSRERLLRSFEVWPPDLCSSRCPFGIWPSDIRSTPCPSPAFALVRRSGRQTSEGTATPREEPRCLERLTVRPRSARQRNACLPRSLAITARALQRLAQPHEDPRSPAPTTRAALSTPGSQTSPRGEPSSALRAPSPRGRRP